MKTQKLNQLLFLLFLASAFTFTACVEDDEFEIPNVNITEPELSGPIRTMASLAGDLAQAQGGSSALDYSNENTTVTFNPNDKFIAGYVVSSDEGGNFFEELIIQDRPSNPTIGIKVLIDVNPLFTKYKVGRKIYINIKNLSVGITNGVLTLGYLNGNEVDKIPAPLETSTILRSAELATLTPVSLDIDDFTRDKTNLYVELNNVQFQSSLVFPNPVSFASEQLDQFDGERTLQSCASGDSATFSTSTFADFKGLLLPQGNGSVKGILTRNFRGNAYIITVNTPEDMDLSNISNRCGCGIATAPGSNIIFEDKFETQTNFSPVSGNGWTNYIEAGTEAWEAYTASGGNASQGISVRASSFRSNDANSVAWLITPAINLDAQNNEVFSFESSNSFSDNSTLTVLFSENWDGTTANITSANWQGLVDATVVSDGEPFGNWVSSGNVDLSCLSGTIHIAFVYRGNDTPTNNFNGTYELDNIKISSN